MSEFMKNMEAGQRIFASTLLLILNNKNLDDDFKLKAIRDICEKTVAKEANTHDPR